MGHRKVQAGQRQSAHKSKVPDHVKNPQKYTCYVLDEPLIIGSGGGGDASQHQPSTVSAPTQRVLLEHQMQVLMSSHMLIRHACLQVSWVPISCPLWYAGRGQGTACKLKEQSWAWGTGPCIC